jgi:hypothetical protein
MQDFMNCRKLIDGERHIYTADDKTVQVEAIENFRLLIKTKFHLDFDETIFVLFFQSKRNLISIYVLNLFGFS